MKLSFLAGCALLWAPATGFQLVPSPRQQHVVCNMFGGAGAGAPTEDNPEEQEKMAQAAKTMGMSPEEYKVAMNARAELARTLDSTMVTGGKADTVLVERDVNNPPKTLKIEITEAGKELGQEGLSKALVSALKSASEASKAGRGEAQKKMMTFISKQLGDGK